MRAALRAHARLLPPHAVRPYVRRNKTDRTDTKGMLEAFRNEEIHPVPVKSVAQQTLAALHRLHSVWLAERTARINTPRALLREFGILIPLGARHAVPCAWAQLEDADSDIPDALRPSLAELCSEIRDLERRIRMIERQLAALATQTPAVAQLLTLPGIGLLIVTALIAFVGDIHRFPSARHFASYLIWNDLVSSPKIGPLSSPSERSVRSSSSGGRSRRTGRGASTTSQSDIRGLRLGVEPRDRTPSRGHAF